MKEEVMHWLQTIVKHEGFPTDKVIAFNVGLFESDRGYMMYLVDSLEYSAEDDDWACVGPPKKEYRYLRFPDDVQSQSWEEILATSVETLRELENEGLLHKTLLMNAKAITTGFDDGELIKIR